MINSFALLFATLFLAPPVSLPELAAPPPDAIRVILVRHGQAFSNLEPKPKLSASELDRLTPKGAEQVRATAQLLRALSPSLLIASPLHRALQTADEIRAILGLERVKIDAGLRPLETGDGGPLTQ